MSRIKTVDVLVSEWGMFDSPPDLAGLWRAAPKILVDYINEDGEPAQREIVDRTTSKGSAYYAREREVLNAISVIFATGTMDVVNTKERR